MSGCVNKMAEGWEWHSSEGGGGTQPPQHLKLAQKLQLLFNIYLAMPCPPPSVPLKHQNTNQEVQKHTLTTHTHTQTVVVRSERMKQLKPNHAEGKKNRILAVNCLFLTAHIQEGGGAK